MSVYILCGAHKALYKIPQKTGTDLSYPLNTDCLGKLLTRNVFFCAFFLAVRVAGGARRRPGDLSSRVQPCAPLTMASLLRKAPEEQRPLALVKKLAPCTCLYTGDLIYVRGV